MTLLDIRGAMVLKIEYLIAYSLLSTVLQAQKHSTMRSTVKFEQAMMLVEVLKRSSIKTIDDAYILPLRCVSFIFCTPLSVTAETYLSDNEQWRFLAN